MSNVVEKRRTGKALLTPRKPSRAKRQAPTLRRQDLLRVAVSCLARFGPRGTTGREICRQAGVSHSLLRHYFDNSDDLLLETYRQLCDEFLDRLTAVLAADEADPWKNLERAFELMFSHDWANAEVLGAWTAFWTLVQNNEAFAAVSDYFNKRLRQMMRKTIQRLPHEEMTMPLGDAIAILLAVMDGLWLDFCLAPKRTPRRRAVGLCKQTARRLFGGA